VKSVSAATFIYAVSVLIGTSRIAGGKALCAQHETFGLAKQAPASALPAIKKLSDSGAFSYYYRCIDGKAYTCQVFGHECDKVNNSDIIRKNATE
jgi:hypothetical protein